MYVYASGRHWNNTKELLDTVVLVRVQYSPRVGGNEVHCHIIVSRVVINVLGNGVMVKQLVCTKLIGEWDDKNTLQEVSGGRL